MVGVFGAEAGEDDALLYGRAVGAFSGAPTPISYVQDAASGALQIVKEELLSSTPGP